MSLLGLLVFIVIIGVIYWCARSLIAAFQIPQPIATVIMVVLVLIILFALLGYLGLGSGPVIRLR